MKEDIARILKYIAPKVSKSFYIFLLLTALISISSCKKTNKIPKDIIPKDQMTMILVDVHRAESMLSVERLSPREKTANIYYRDIFEKHNITEEDFFKSLDYYYMHLNEMKDIYENVVDQLNKEQ